MLHLFESNNLLQSSLAHHIYACSQEAISHRGRFTVALSGGSLPKMLSKLATFSEDRKDMEAIDWDKWYFVFADERIVPLDHEDSTYKLCQDVFFSKLSTPQPQIIAIDPTLSDPSRIASDYDMKLRDLLGQEMVVDLALLGMGPDGHTASLFPDHPLFTEATARSNYNIPNTETCVSISDTKTTSTSSEKNQPQIQFIIDSPKPPPQRVTFNLPMLNKAREVIFVATGSSKASLFQKAFTIVNPTEKVSSTSRGEDTTSQQITLHSSSSAHYDLIRSYPCFMVKPVSGKLTWYTDQEGGSLLPEEILELARKNADVLIDKSKDSKL